MNQYRYIGGDDNLIGHTALGQFMQGVFKVQVDEFNHAWSHGWHATDIRDWEPIESAFDE